MEITMLGTGNAGATEYFNTCFVIKDEEKYFLVDTGGGNGLLGQMKKAGVPLNKITDIFITHRHSDHTLGLVWIFRFLSKSSGRDAGRVRIYGNSDVIRLAKTLIAAFFTEMEVRKIENAFELIQVEDGQEYRIIGRKVRFFDIHSTKAYQFGFSMELDGGRLTCFGDEPYNETCIEYMKGTTWLMHEAFCMYADAEKYHPHEKSHSTVKDACETAERFGVAHLIIYHTEEQTVGCRKELYRAEGSQYFSGDLIVPDDLETIKINRRPE